jgi:hypothetical protein
MRLTVPDADDFEQALTFSRAAADHGASEDLIEFDFSGVQFATPGWMLLVGGVLKNLRERYPHRRRRAINHKHLTYAAHVGFFKYFGLDFGLAPAEAPGNLNYLPITEVDVQQLKSRAAAEFKPPGDIIERDAHELAVLLTRDRANPVTETLTYSIRELVRNVVEHSGASSYSIAAQYWPTRKLAEVAVSDHGCGIAASLSENPRVNVPSDLDALKLAILPGVSSKAWRGSENDDPWANSGYGLYMIQRLCSSGGVFHLASGDAAIALVNTGVEETRTQFPGTLVVMQLRAEEVVRLAVQLRKFRDEGMRVSKEIGGATTLGPSLASQMLQPQKDS